MKKINPRQNEIECLNSIRDSFINLAGIEKVFDNTDFLTMKQILETAYQNEKHSEFPDFFFDGGVIEHFEVTASDTIGKGSQYRYEDARHRKENRIHLEQLDKEYSDNPYQSGTISTEVVEDIYSCFSYESFVRSFKRNVEQHLESLMDSEYKNKIVVFLIEQDAARLGVYSGEKFDRFYKLSEDKNLLQYMKKTMIDVDYVIYTCADAYEIIDLSKIDSVLKHAKCNLDVRCEKQRNISIKFWLDS